MKVAILASGAGSNVAAILAHIERGQLTETEVVWIVSNRSASGALAIAKRYEIEATHLSDRTHPNPVLRETVLLTGLREHGAQLVVLAGYLKLVPQAVIAAFPGRILNIHPGPLPRFGGPGMYGRYVHGAVLADRRRWSEVCVFEVTPQYDRGPIVAREAVPVLPGDTTDTLSARVQRVEHALYWRVIQRYAQVPW